MRDPTLSGELTKSLRTKIFLQWPANSADLSLIEHIWNILKMRIRNRKTHQNIWSNWKAYSRKNGMPSQGRKIPIRLSLCPVGIAEIVRAINVINEKSLRQNKLFFYRLRNLLGNLLFL